MLPYWLLLLFTGISGFLLCELKQSRRRNFIFIAVLTVLMAAMALFRADTVGVDTTMYMDYYNQICGQNLSFLFDRANIYWKEPGYSLLNFIFSRVMQDPRMFVGIVSAVIIILRGIFVCRYSWSPWISMFVFVSFNFFGYAMCTLRQEMAISIALFALPFLQKKKLIPYLLITALAATFHFSAWILLPVYFIANLPLNRITLGIYTGGTLFVLLFSEPMLAFVTKYIYQHYTPGSYYTQGRDYSTAVFPVSVFILAVLLLKKLLSIRKENQVLVNYSCYAAFLFVLTLKHFIFQRVALLFLPAVLLLIPELIRCTALSGEKAAELNRLKEDKARQKQNRDKITALRAELKNETALYYTSMGLILAGCTVYFLFLLTTNRLLLVPYIPFWLA